MKIKHKIVDGKKPCSKCKKILPISCFGKCMAAPSELDWYCRKCQSKRVKPYQDKNRRKINAQKREHYRKNWTQLNGDYSRARNLFNKHKMTLEEYDNLFEAQDGVCAICGLPEINQRLAVDHDHKTGEIRALLCGNCNCALGHARDNEERLMAMIKYLRKHNQVKVKIC